MHNFFKTPCLLLFLAGGKGAVCRYCGRWYAFSAAFACSFFTVQQKFGYGIKIAAVSKVGSRTLCLVSGAAAIKIRRLPVKEGSPDGA